MTLDPPFSEDKFELFYVEADPGETTNLALEHPEMHRELLELWRTERTRLGIVLPHEVQHAGLDLALDTVGPRSRAGGDRPRTPRAAHRPHRQRTQHSRRALSIFAMHGTAIPAANDLYDSDIHVLVSRRVERALDAMNGDAASATHLFFNGVAGDISPVSNTRDQCPVATLRTLALRSLAFIWNGSALFWNVPGDRVRAECVSDALQDMQPVGYSIGRAIVALFGSLDTPERDPVVARAFSAHHLGGRDALPQVSSGASV